MIKIINGNILDAKEDVIGHQVNCMGVMGSGLAKQIRSKYPEVYTDYKYLVDSKDDKSTLLGSIQFIDCKDGKIIANIFGQYRYGKDKQHTNYRALESSFKSLLYSVTSPNCLLKDKTIALPYNLGCGLAGGDWNIVYGIIEEVFKDYNVTLYKL